MPVNHLADVSHTLWVGAGKPIPEFNFNITAALILPTAILIAVVVLKGEILIKNYII